MAVQLLARADDFGSARSANQAILEGVQTGHVVRNVSCMAVAPFIEEGARELKNFKNISIGLHAAITSEWEEISWGPVSGAGACRSFTDEKGHFFQSVEEIALAAPDPDLILKEYDAQLDKLTRLGLHVEYADSHMAPELMVPGLLDAFREWTRKKGLLDAYCFYHIADQPIPSYAEDTEHYLDEVEKWLKSLEDGKQYFYLTHPAKASWETELFWNRLIPRGRVRAERELEYQAVTSNRWTAWAERYKIRPVRFTEAKLETDGVEQMRKFLKK